MAQIRILKEVAGRKVGDVEQMNSPKILKSWLDGGYAELTSKLRKRQPEPKDDTVVEDRAMQEPPRTRRKVKSRRGARSK